MKYYRPSNYYVACFVFFILTLLSNGCSETVENPPLVSVDKFRISPSSEEFFSPGETEEITLTNAGTYTFSLSVGEYTDSGQQRINFDGYEGTSWRLYQIPPSDFTPNILALFYPEILPDTSHTTTMKIFVAGTSVTDTFRVKLQATGPSLNAPKELLLTIYLILP